MAFLRLGLQFTDEIIDPAVRAEFEQLVAALQRDGINIITPENGGLGIDASAVLDGQLLIGSAALHAFVLARLTAGAGISVGNAAGAITLTNTGALVAFKTIAVAGQSDVVADAAADTLTLVAGSNVTITTTPGTDTVTISVAGGGGLGTVTSVATDDTYVSGGPITGTGTIAAAVLSKAAIDGANHALYGGI